MKTVLLFVCLFGLAFAYTNSSSSSSESSESSKSDSSDSSSEESHTTGPAVTATAKRLTFPRGDNFRARRDLVLNLLKRDLKGKKRGSSSESDDSTTHSEDRSSTTKSTSTHSHSSESSEEHTNPTLQKVVFTPEPNTSEESSEERTTKIPVV
ncbi:secretory calcium-binding phosphoprotein acidic 2 precursor [Xenopus tropicalis]|nr:secretory calcium-binding phosphoprotein acidic 2 precursor [Xenopus tropicalis]ACF33445.1 secretory calcium-binding phosphoprotein acidic 2 [Xenopus tropicalis]|eukprot:NP_001139219.1 secretory calcium-binding phosphoprotein acidic 2 precursor [Xenopus tropicalis]